MWPPEPVVFGPNPVKRLSISYCDGRVRLTLRLSRPVVEDIMVFAQAPCSAGRKKWRHGAYLGLLPPPVGGECDITEKSIAKYRRTQAWQEGVYPHPAAEEWLGRRGQGRQ